MNILLRRARKDKTTCEGIANVSTTGLKSHRVDRRLSEPVDYLFRWGCILAAPSSVEVNTADAIHWCNNKRQSRLDMQESGVSVPRTMTTEEFLTREFTPEEYIPYVLRRATHSQGRDIWYGGISTIRDEIRQQAVSGGYVSEFIGKRAEYRIMVVCNRVAWVAKKTPGNPEDVAWNVDQGGRFDNVRWGDWPMAAIKEALAAMAVGDVDFGGVDVMVDADGKAYVLEINSAPSHESEYRTSCTAKCFDYIVEHGKDHFDPPEKYRSWKNVIHPALWTREE